MKSLNTIYKSRGEPEYVREQETQEYNPNDPSEKAKSIREILNVYPEFDINETNKEYVTCKVAFSI